MNPDWMTDDRDTSDADDQAREEVHLGPFAGFLRRGERLPVPSSNVMAATYDAHAQTLTVEYLDGRAYRYGDIDEAEALSFATAPSHGEWVWDHLRIRGTKNGHRKPWTHA